MKKLSRILMATVLAAAIGNVYADDENLCPSIWTVRDSGSKFTHAYRDSATGSGKTVDMWMVTSEPFSFGADYWQTVYIAKMAGVTDPQAAVEMAQHDYDYSILMAKPQVSVFGTSIQCMYSPEGSNYYVMAVNEILAGFKKFK